MAAVIPIAAALLAAKQLEQQKAGDSQNPHSPQKEAQPPLLTLKPIKGFIRKRPRALCPAPDCQYLWDASHANQFEHACPLAKCDKKDEDHARKYVHPCPNSKTGCSELLQPTPEDAYHFDGFSHGETNCVRFYRHESLGAITLQLHQGDLTDQRTDAIIISQDTKLSCNGNVSKQVISRGGRQILSECEQLLRLHGQFSSEAGGKVVRRGQILLTSAGKLDCQYVLHAVPPLATRNPEEMRLPYQSLILSCLAACHQLWCGSVAAQTVIYAGRLESVSLPAIGVRHDMSFVAKEILTALKIHAQKYPDTNLQIVRITQINRKDLDVFMQIADQLFAPPKGGGGADEKSSRSAGAGGTAGATAGSSRPPTVSSGSERAESNRLSSGQQLHSTASVGDPDAGDRKSGASAAVGLDFSSVTPAASVRLNTRLLDIEGRGSAAASAASAEWNSPRELLKLANEHAMLGRGLNAGAADDDAFADLDFVSATPTASEQILNARLVDTEERGCAAASAAVRTASAASAVTAASDAKVAKLLTAPLCTRADPICQFRVVTFNVLSHRYIGNFYRNYPNDAIAWEHRRRTLLRNIKSLNADILCMQEVDNEFVADIAESLGAACLFANKTHGREEGLVIWFNPRKFSKVDCKTLKLPHAELNKGGQIALLAVLEVKPKRDLEPFEETPQRLLVVNTHLLGDPKMKKEQLDQVKYIVATALPKLIHSKSGESMPVIFCGDFNAGPESWVYKWICDATFDPPLDNYVAEMSVRFPHEVQLRSAYAQVWGREPTSTFRTDALSRPVDYIWFSGGQLLRPASPGQSAGNSVLELDVPASKYRQDWPREMPNCEGTEPLPTRAWGSDHVPVIVSMVYRQLVKVPSAAQPSEQTLAAKLQDNAARMEQMEQEIARSKLKQAEGEVPSPAPRAVSPAPRNQSAPSSAFPAAAAAGSSHFAPEFASLSRHDAPKIGKGAESKMKIIRTRSCQSAEQQSSAPQKSRPDEDRGNPSWFKLEFSFDKLADRLVAGAAAARDSDLPSGFSSVNASSLAANATGTLTSASKPAQQQVQSEPNEPASLPSAREHNAQLADKQRSGENKVCGVIEDETRMQQLEREIAQYKLKQAAGEKTEAMLKEFRQECKHLQDLKHGNIVRLLAACDGDQQILLTEYCERGSIADILKHEDSARLLTDERKWQLLLQLAEALEFLHERTSPIVHRDVKTTNVLVTQSWLAKLADFGSARQQTLAAGVFSAGGGGTFAFQAPEQFLENGNTELGAKVLVGTPADIYGFAGVALHVLTRRPPFDGCQPARIVADVLGMRKPPPELSLLQNAGMQRAQGQAQFLARCFAFVPSERPKAADVVKFCQQQLEVAEQLAAQSVSVQQRLSAHDRKLDGLLHVTQQARASATADLSGAEAVLGSRAFDAGDRKAGDTEAYAEWSDCWDDSKKDDIVIVTASVRTV